MYCVAFKKDTRVQHIYCMLFSGRKTSGEKVFLIVFFHYLVLYLFAWLWSCFDDREMWKTSSCGSPPRGTTCPTLWLVSETSKEEFTCFSLFIFYFPFFVVFCWSELITCRLSLIPLRSRVPLQHPDEPRETRGLPAAGRQHAPRWQEGSLAGGAAAGVQAVPIHPETPTHRDAHRVRRWAQRISIYYICLISCFDWSTYFECEGQKN